MLQVGNTALILVDVQGKLASVMYQSEELIGNIEKLVKGAQLLEVPIIWLEQYPKGLGTTAETISQHLSEQEPIEKMRFSGYQEAGFQAALAKSGADNFLIAGIESHVCVYQTAKELLAAGKGVELVVDCVSSRTEVNRDIGIRKTLSLGARETSIEMALFELLGSAEHAKFKEISRLIK